MASRKIKEINIAPFEDRKLDHAFTMIPEAVGSNPDKDTIDKVIEDFIFDFDTYFRYQEQLMTDIPYRMLVLHSHDHGRIMDLLSSLRYANMVEIMSWDEVRRVIRDSYQRHREHFDDVFADYVRLRKALSRQKT